MDPLKQITEFQPTRRAVSIIQEFRDFAFKGSMITLAIGVIIGTAFNNLIDSLVKNVLMPLIGLLLPGQHGYLGWKLVFGEQEVPYGHFLGELVKFVIVALAVFLFMVKFLGWLTRARHAEAAAPPPPTRDQELLAEIRDLLRQGSRPAAATS
jgi:large conductance mechanosensitive channel